MKFINENMIKNDNDDEELASLAIVHANLSNKNYPDLLFGIGRGGHGFLNKISYAFDILNKNPTFMKKHKEVYGEKAHYRPYYTSVTMRVYSGIAQLSQSVMIDRQNRPLIDELSVYINKGMIKNPWLIDDVKDTETTLSYLNENFRFDTFKKFNLIMMANKRHPPGKAKFILTSNAYDVNVGVWLVFASDRSDLVDENTPFQRLNMLNKKWKTGEEEAELKKIVFMPAECKYPIDKKYFDVLVFGSSSEKKNTINDLVKKIYNIPYDDKELIDNFEKYVPNTKELNDFLMK